MSMIQKTVGHLTVLLGDPNGQENERVGTTVSPSKLKLKLEQSKRKAKEIDCSFCGSNTVPPDTAQC